MQGLLDEATGTCPLSSLPLNPLCAPFSLIRQVLLSTNIYNSQNFTTKSFSAVRSLDNLTGIVAGIDEVPFLRRPV